MSPTLFREKGYRFFFFSREELRMHVQHSNGEAKFWIEPFIELAHNFGLATHELKEVEQIVKSHQQDIKNA
jgi:hypothetical protein